MWHLRNYETKRSLRKKYKHCKEQLEYTRKSLSTKNDEEYHEILKLWNEQERGSKNESPYN